MNAKNFRDALALVYFVVLLLWLAIVCVYILPNIVIYPDALDPTLALIAGLGIGGVTQFLIVIGTLVFQFYFRKKEGGS